MRGVVVGFFLIVLLSGMVLWRRPGGLRRQLRAIRHRFHLVTLLVGIYLLAAFLIHFLIADSNWQMGLTVAIAVALTITFLIKSDYTTN